jgi:hypothetical protein
MPNHNEHGTVNREKTFTVRVVLCQNSGTKESPKWIPVPSWAKPIRQERGGFAYVTAQGPVFCSYRMIGQFNIFEEIQKLNGFKDNKKK